VPRPADGRATGDCGCPATHTQGGGNLLARADRPSGARSFAKRSQFLVGVREKMPEPDAAIPPAVMAAHEQVREALEALQVATGCPGCFARELGFCRRCR
jgi:hypothetical protein